MAAVRVTRAFIPMMQQANWGRIVLFASEDAVQPYIEELPYCASKAGILSLTGTGRRVSIDTTEPYRLRLNFYEFAHCFTSVNIR